MYQVPFLESCSGCEGFTQIETSREYLVIDAIHASVGDRVSCSRCECTGVIDIDDKGQFCNWNEALCETCSVSFERELDALAAHLGKRVLQILGCEDTPV